MRSRATFWASVLSTSVVLLLVLTVLPTVASSIAQAPAPQPLAPPTAASPSLASLAASYDYLSAWPASTQALATDFDRALPSLANLDGIIPWTAFLQILNDSRAGNLTQAKTDALLTLAAGGSGISLEGALVVLGLATLVGCGIGLIAGPIGCLAGVLVGAAIVGISLLLSYFNGNNYQRTSAVLQANTMLGAMDDVLELNENSTRTEEAALNLTAVALDYQASSAALLQLGNVSYNPQLDGVQSDLLPGIYSVFEADLLDIDGIAATEFNQFDSVFSGSGYYGGQGIVCQVYSSLTMGPGEYVGIGQFRAPYTDGGYVGNSGGCLGESGTPSWGVWATPVGGAGSMAGIQVSFHDGFGTSGVPNYIQHGSPLFFGPGALSYPYATLQLRPLAGFGTEWFNVTGQTGQWLNYTGPTGAYYFSEEPCSSAAISSCVGTGSPPTKFVTAGSVWPVAGVNEAQVSVGGWLNVTTTTADNGPLTVVNNFWECESGVSPLSTGFQVNTGADGALSAAVPACGAGTEYLATELNNLLVGAENVGGTYWTFLTAQGYTSASQVPARCVIPSVSDAVPNWTPQELAQAGVANLTKIYYAYLLQLGYTFNVSASLNATTFCGKHVKEPVGGWESLFGAPVPVNATGDIYIPNATGKIPAGQVATLKQTVVGTEYGSAIGLAPFTTVTTHETIVVVAGAYGAALSSVNDSLGNTFAKMSVGNGAGGYAAVFVDNATTVGGSNDYLTVHPASTTYVTAVAYLFKATEVFNVSWGAWVNPPPDASKVTWASPTGSLSVSGLIGTGGPLTNVTVPSAATGCVNATESTKSQTMSCVYATTATPTTHIWGFGTAGWATPFGVSVTAGGGGPAVENISNPLTWNLTGVEFTVIPSIASITVGMNRVWEMPYYNPSQILVAGTPNATALPVFGGAPVGFLSNVLGNSTVLYNGSAYPNETDHTLLGNGYAVDVLTCSVQEPSGAYSNFTSACPFDRQTLVGYYTNYSCLIFDNCAGPAPPVPSGTNCNAGYFEDIVGPIASVFGFLGSTLGCAIGWILTAVAIIVLIVVVVWLVAFAVREFRGGRD